MLNIVLYLSILTSNISLLLSEPIILIIIIIVMFIRNHSSCFFSFVLVLNSFHNRCLLIRCLQGSFRNGRLCFHVIRLVSHGSFLIHLIFLPLIDFCKCLHYLRQKYMDRYNRLILA